MKQETSDKMSAAIQATPPDELYKQLFGFYEKDYIEYVEDKHYEFEAQYVVDAMTKLGVTEINVYDGEIQPPSKMFFHYLHNNAETGIDDEFWKTNSKAYKYSSTKPMTNSKLKNPCTTKKA